MTNTNGALKTKSVTLQGSGANPDFKMLIDNDVYKLNRGTTTLLTVAADELTTVADQSGGTITHEKVTIGTNTDIEGTLNINGDLQVKNFTISQDGAGDLIIS